MKDMARRLDNLEIGTGSGLSPSAMAWLGHPLRANEQRSLQAELARECATIDTVSLSPEARRWLAR